METDRQIGGGRGDAWEATAKTAMTGKNTWEMAQILAVAGETFFRMFAKRSMN